MKARPFSTGCGNEVIQGQVRERDRGALCQWMIVGQSSNNQLLCDPLKCQIWNDDAWSAHETDIGDARTYRCHLPCSRLLQ